MTWHALAQAARRASLGSTLPLQVAHGALGAGHVPHYGAHRSSEKRTSPVATNAAHPPSHRPVCIATT